MLAPAAARPGAFDHKPTYFQWVPLLLPLEYTSWVEESGWTGSRRKAAGERVDPVSGSSPTDPAIGPPSDATTLRAFQDSAGPLGRHFLLYNLQDNFLLDDTDEYVAR